MDLLSLSGVELAGTSSVRLIYCDESGLSIERVLVVAGVIIEADVQYMPVAAYLKSLIEKYISPEDRWNFSFRARDLFSGSKIYNNRSKYPLQTRIEILEYLLAVPGLFQIPVV